MARILVVDDRPTNFLLLEAVLGHYGHGVERAADGVEALRTMASWTPDLVITDLLMPNLDGEELCRRMRATEALRNVPIVIHTASYRARDARRIADRLQVRWIIPKPSDPAEIIAIVSEALGAAEDVRQAVAATAVGMARPSVAGLSRQEQHARLAQLLTDALELARAQGHASAQAAAGAADARQESLVRLAVRISWERDLGSLVDILCDSAQEMLGARYVGVAIVEPGGMPEHFAARGMDAAVAAAVGREMGMCAAARHVLGDATRPRMFMATRGSESSGLPAAHPPVHDVLATAVTSRDAAVGWIYVADHVGEAGFSTDDERLLVGLGALLGTSRSSLRAMEDLDRRVAQRTQDLDAANAELEAFTMIVSHDLRSPLASIGGFARALSERFGGHLPPEGQRYLGRIEENVATMSTLIDDLLRFARTSRQPLRLEQVDLAALVRRSLVPFEDEIQARGVTVLVGDLPACRADPVLLGQVLHNLLANAVKYTRKQPFSVIEVGGRRVGGEHLVFVRDNGAGFDSAYADKLFKPFQRLHTAGEFEGSGVGLAIVSQIVGRHGGRVWAQSEPGAGACFQFTLPASPAAP